MTNLFKKIFNRKVEPDLSEQDTVPVDKAPDQTAESFDEPTLSSETAPLSDKELIELTQQLSPTQFIVGCGHSVGRQRDHNEDALFTLTTTLVTDSKQIPFGLYIVADGMGGHQHGELASALAIRAISSQIIKRVYVPLFEVAAQMPGDPLQEIMQEAVMKGHQAIINEAVNSGTTATAAVIFGDQLMISHVGDSRAYSIYPDGSFKILTRDHSLVKRLEELGQITSEEAAIHPQRNVLYRALGQNEPFEPDNSSYPLPKGGQLMICSDGLWGLLSDEEMMAIITNTSNPEIACQKLVDAANLAGGPDNITVILVRIPV